MLQTELFGRPALSQRSILPAEFEADTGLRPDTYVAGAGVDLWRYFQDSTEADAIEAWYQSYELSAEISEKLHRVYARSAEFRGFCRGIGAGDHVRAAIQYWVASSFVREFPQLKSKLPPEFRVGQPMPPGTRATFAPARHLS